MYPLKRNLSWFFIFFGGSNKCRTHMWMFFMLGVMNCEILHSFMSANSHHLGRRRRKKQWIPIWASRWHLWCLQCPSGFVVVPLVSLCPSSVSVSLLRSRQSSLVMCLRSDSNEMDHQSEQWSVGLVWKTKENHSIWEYFKRKWKRTKREKYAWPLVRNSEIQSFLWWAAPWKEKKNFRLYFSCIRWG